MILRAKRVALAAATLSLTGCVLLSGADAFVVADGTVPPAADDAASGADAAPKSGDASTGFATVSPEVDASQPSPPSRPNQGKYTYAVTGSEELKGVFPYKAKYGPTATVTIEHDGADCFKQTISLRSGYDEVMHECVVGFGVAQNTGTRSQKFPLIGGATTALTCEPGDVYFGTDRVAGLPLAHTCDGKNSDDKSGASGFTTAGTYTFVGEETVEANGVGLPVLHYHDDRTVTGKQTGTNVADWYFATDGTLVQLTRNIAIAYPSIIGQISYIETVTMTLSGLPQSN